MNALIGYTGFIGKNLKNQHKFDSLFNSKNITEIENNKYDLIICAGAYGQKWLANKYKEKDLDQIKHLCNNLSKTYAKKFVLISTVCVYDDLEESSYGANRLFLEKEVEGMFSNSTIIRLPSLFGIGLKKNYIYDLINSDTKYLPNKSSEIQYYYLKYLWSDIQIAISNNLKRLNICSEPIIFTEILNLFNMKDINLSNREIRYENIKTKYSNLWGNDSDYLYSSTQVIDDLKDFIQVNQ